jgi:CRP-like cAMP-binding protein
MSQDQIRTPDATGGSLGLAVCRASTAHVHAFLSPGGSADTDRMTSSDFGRPHPTAEQLMCVPLLASLSSQQLADLAEFIDVVEVPSGQVIVGEGTAGYAVYILIEGTVQVRHGETVVRTLSPPDFFGEVVMIDNARRTATVVAAEPCVLWSMFGTTYRVLEAEHPEVAKVLQHAADTRRD